MGSTNVQLNKMLKELDIKNYIGYFSKNEILSCVNSSSFCCLCNFQNKKQPGSHHVANWQKNIDCRYFDSFGAPVLNEIKKLAGKNKLWEYQAFDGIKPDKIIQNPESDLCGELSVLFLFLCDAGYSFEYIINNMMSATH